jgi:hypothetical protein
VRSVAVLSARTIAKEPRTPWNVLFLLAARFTYTALRRLLSYVRVKGISTVHEANKNERKRMKQRRREGVWESETRRRTRRKKFTIVLSHATTLLYYTTAAMLFSYCRSHNVCDAQYTSACRYSWGHWFYANVILLITIHKPEAQHSLRFPWTSTYEFDGKLRQPSECLPCFATGFLHSFLTLTPHTVFIHFHWFTAHNWALVISNSPSHFTSHGLI